LFALTGTLGLEFNVLAGKVILLLFKLVVLIGMVFVILSLLLLPGCEPGLHAPDLVFNVLVIHLSLAALHHLLKQLFKFGICSLPTCASFHLYLF